MLDYEELKKTANLRRLSQTNTEKDYLQDLILFSLYSDAGKELVFKGGTCLYKIYRLNRFSEDLDFTLTKKLDINKLSNKIISDLNLLDINCKIKEIIEHKNQANIRLLINGPLYKGSKQTQCFIPLNISMKEQVLLEPKKESVITIYKELSNFGLFVMQEREILSEKVRAIFTRLKPRDVYDLWFLLVIKGIDFDVGLINKKLAVNNLEFSFKEFMKRVERMKGFWQTDIKNLIIGDLPDFSKIKKGIELKLL